MTIATRFKIKDFSAWAPGIENLDGWQQLFQTQKSPAPDEKPDLSFLPPMQRRRLSPLARAAFYVMNNLDVSDRTYTPTVFCSQFGESQRTYKILKDIAQHEDMSPTAFSLSVHNAISGQTSIQFKNRAPITAIGSDDTGYLNAFVDALGHLGEHEEVMLVFYEENQPEFYGVSDKSTDFPCACAVLISKGSDNEEMLHSLDFNAEQDTKPANSPQLLALIEFLQTSQDQLSLGQWQLTKNA